MTAFASVIFEWMSALAVSISVWALFMEEAADCPKASNSSWSAFACWIFASISFWQVQLSLLHLLDLVGFCA